MGTYTEGRNWLARSGPGALAVIVIGALLGYHLAGDIFEVPVQNLVIQYVLGIVWAFLFLEIVDAIYQGLGFFADPLPKEMDWGRRDMVREHVAKLKGLKELVARSRHLLEAWLAGYRPGELVALASFESERARAQLRPGVFLVFLLLVPCIWFRPNALAGWGALAVLAVTSYIRNQLLGRMDHYVEVRLLARLPAEVPGTAVTAAELGDLMGQAVDRAFQKYVPQPERMAEAVAAAAEKAGQATSEQLQQLQKVFLENQAAVLEKAQAALRETSAPLLEAQKELSAVSRELTAGFRAGTEKLHDVMKGQVEALKGALETAAERLREPLGKMAAEIEKALRGLTEQVRQSQGAAAEGLKATLTQHAQQVAAAGGAWKEQLQGALAEHAAQVQKATADLAGQLARIADLQKEIEKVLRVQEAVEATLRTVTTTEEFQKTLAGLRAHLEAADNLLREVSKPRTIRLVETEGELEQA